MGSASPPSTLQLSSARDLPSLSTTHPINGTNSQPPEETAGPEPKAKHFKSTYSEKKANEAIVRAAKAEIRNKLREDWEFPLPVECPTLCFKVEEVEWVEREADDASSHLASPSENIDPLEFRNPNPFDLGLAGKDCKGSTMGTEAQSNPGLQHFLLRRDAWTGARHRRPPSPLTDSTSPRHPHMNNVAMGSPTSTTSSGSPSSSSTLCPPTSPSSTETLNPPEADVLIPIGPPTLPSTHPIRASVTSATYPSLYSKIAIQGLAPTIPINLKDMTQALVAGWQKDGEWPPKSEAAENECDARNGRFTSRGGHSSRLSRDVLDDSIQIGARTGKKLARRSVGRVKKVLGMGSSGGSGDGREEVAGEVKTAEAGGQAKCV
ncbi:uncharacterized protein KY384_004508 [Bacidia gigantensis]|uniref:uncharacterized protein n=1 Tax=Bacidia gigantensis TaxID=2732470 RepID=UPI001D054A42|nr:uncharacterized protein KY384_004508 [Bacidia gigantensis]KAG8531150.1 hypothetical protein KY384_004508 [Bacidia gigantensis]